MIFSLLIMTIIGLIAVVRSTDNPLEHNCTYHTESYGQLDTTVFEYCKLPKRDRDSINMVSAAPTYSSMKEFMSFLRAKDFKLLYVGDAISMHMFNALKYNLHMEGESKGAERGLVRFHLSNLLTSLAHQGPDPDSRLVEQRLASASDVAAWTRVAVEAGVTHIVFTSGAWFSHQYHLKHGNGTEQQALTDDELVAAFAAHFAPGSELYDTIDRLRRVHNVRFIWRDIAAAGRCGAAIGEPSVCRVAFPLFPVFNAIARKSILGLGGLVIPDVWSTSLGAWPEHCNYATTPGGVQSTPRMCLEAVAPVVRLWNSKLYSLLRRAYDIKTPASIECRAHNHSAYGGGDTDTSVYEYCRDTWPYTPKIVLSSSQGGLGKGKAVPLDRYYCDPGSARGVEVAQGSASALSRHSMIDLISFLRRKAFKLLYVGDSLSLQMFNALKYSLRLEGHEGLESGLVDMQKSQYLAPLTGIHPQMFGLSFTEEEVVSTSWAQVAIDTNVTHIVINVGAWFSHQFLIYRRSHPHYRTPGQALTDDELVAAFAAHFAPGSELYDTIDRLRRVHNVRFIWRDIAAAGRCGAAIGEPSVCRVAFPLFPVFNAIARKSILGLGGLVIPDVWSTSLGAWPDHVLRDGLHWCLGGKYSVPGLWNSKLYDLLLLNDKTKLV